MLNFPVPNKSLSGFQNFPSPSKLRWGFPDFRSSVIKKVVSALWTPAEITTALWLDAADSDTITLVTGAVSQWNDKSGNSRHISQGTSGKRPTGQSGVLNDLDIIRFDGSDDYLSRGETSAFKDISSALIYAVLKPAVVSSDKRYFNVSTTGDFLNVMVLLGVGRSGSKWGIAGRRLAADTYTEKYSSGDASTTGFSLVGSLFNYAGAAYEMFINGTGEGSSTFLTAGDTANSNERRVSVGGALSGNGEFFTGDIAEIIVIPDDATQETRQLVEGYLAHKWGLEANLPSDHPYKDDAPLIE